MYCTFPGLADPFYFRGCRIRLFEGDITSLEVDAIVNSANSQLWMASGVAAAIRSAGGRAIEREAMGLAPRECGEAVVTAAGALPARYVIHAVTLVPGGRADAAVVRRAMASVLRRCVELGVARVAVPTLGSGAGRLSVEAAARAMLDGLALHAAQCPLPAEVIFVHPLVDVLRIIASLLATLPGPPPLPRPAYG